MIILLPPDGPPSRRPWERWAGRQAPSTHSGLVKWELLSRLLRSSPLALGASGVFSPAKWISWLKTRSSDHGWHWGSSAQWPLRPTALNLQTRARERSGVLWYDSPVSNGGGKNKYQFLRGALNQDGFSGTALLFNLAAHAGGVSGVRRATGEHASRAAKIIILPFLWVATRKLIKEGRATGRSSARFLRRRTEFAGLH